MAQIGWSLGSGHNSLALFLLGLPVDACLSFAPSPSLTAARDPGDLIDQKLGYETRIGARSHQLDYILKKL